MTSDEQDRENKELRILYYSLREEVAVMRVGVENMKASMQNIKESQDKTNKILMSIAGLIGSSFLLAVLNLVLKSGIGGGQ